MNRTRILLVLVITLVAMNVGLIYVHFFKNDGVGKGERDNLRSWLTRNLELSKEQESKHVTLRNAYFDELKTMNDSLRQIKARFVSYSANYELSDSMSTLWTDSINRWHARADLLTYRHVRNVRTILTPKQLPIWDSLMQVVMLGKSRE